MNLDITPLTIALHYQGLIDGIIIDESDIDFKKNIEQLGINVMTANIVMQNDEEKIKLSEACLDFIKQLSKK